jgi:hypothetical protein
VQVKPAGIGQDDPLAHPAEQFDPEPVLQLADLLGHRPLGQVQLLGRAGETEVPGGAFKGDQRVRRRDKGAAHGISVSSFHFVMNDGGAFAFSAIDLRQTG